MQPKARIVPRAMRPAHGWYANKHGCSRFVRVTIIGSGRNSGGLERPQEVRPNLRPKAEPGIAKSGDSAARLFDNALGPLIPVNTGEGNRLHGLHS